MVKYVQALLQNPRIIMPYIQEYHDKLDDGIVDFELLPTSCLATKIDGNT